MTNTWVTVIYVVVSIALIVGGMIRLNTENDGDFKALYTALFVFGGIILGTWAGCCWSYGMLGNPWRLPSDVYYKVIGVGEYDQTEKCTPVFLQYADGSIRAINANGQVAFPNGTLCSVVSINNVNKLVATMYPHSASPVSAEAKPAIAVTNVAEASVASRTNSP